MKNITILLMLLVGFPFLANAEMEKVANICENEICFYWWPKLPKINGWHNDRELNIKTSTNIMLPNGYTFENAETVMYAKALYKPRIPKTTSVTILIENDKEQFLSSFRDIEIKEVSPLVTSDGKTLRSFTFFPRSNGNWERVSYGEESDFYLIFTVSSRTKDGYIKNLKTYEELINKYRETP